MFVFDDLQRGIYMLQNYCQENKLRISSQKSKYFYLKTELLESERENNVINENILEQVYYYKLLLISL